MYSININGEVLDFKYKKLTDICYAFYIGNILIGQVFKMNSNNWSAVSNEPNELSPIDGFKNRFYASQFLLKLNGYW